MQYDDLLGKLKNLSDPELVAGMIDDPRMVTEEQLEIWVNDFDFWDVCDQCCMNLFEKAEFVKRAGFVMMDRLAVNDKKATMVNLNSSCPSFKGRCGTIGTL
ncbi:MAG: hypothetical protein QF713_02385 [Dehalococcoidales bacterium]|jgi:3-methyladenine DNA glycosylase AlkD|nr:hypothetical protein [Dehalococcoidales bacterium]MDP7525170.1 hypothetical protein [Dehalococcoidales bacterium]